jgi:anhydro-N-acetylmuramic acid kinase
VARSLDFVAERPRAGSWPAAGRRIPNCCGCSASPERRDRPRRRLGWSAAFLEAQAFAYLAVRSLKGLPITFPSTTGVRQAMTGGVLTQPLPQMGEGQE